MRASYFGEDLRRPLRPLKVSDGGRFGAERGGGHDRSMIELKAIESKRTSAGRGRIRCIPRNLTVAATAVIGLLTLTATARPQVVVLQPTSQATKEARHAKGAKHAKKRRVISVTVNKGETYTISGLKQGAKTGSKAGKNPNALSIQPQPSGDIVLLGTEGGSWKIDATLASGEEVTYDVKVKAEAPPINSLVPGTAPTAIAP